MCKIESHRFVFPNKTLICVDSDAPAARKIIFFQSIAFLKIEIIEHIVLKLLFAVR